MDEFRYSEDDVGGRPEWLPAGSDDTSTKLVGHQDHLKTSAVSCHASASQNRIIYCSISIATARRSSTDAQHVDNSDPGSTANSRQSASCNVKYRHLYADHYHHTFGVADTDDDTASTDFIDALVSTQEAKEDKIQIAAHTNTTRHVAMESQALAHDVGDQRSDVTTYVVRERLAFHRDVSRGVCVCCDLDFVDVGGDV